MAVLRPFIALLLAGSVAHADAPDRELARSRYATAQALVERGRYAEALAEFEAAKRLMNSPAFDYNIALCLVELDRPGEAAEALERYLAAKPDDEDAAKIRARIEELRQKAAQRKTATLKKPESNSDLKRGDERRRLFTRAAIGTLAVAGGLLVTAAATGGVALQKRADYDRGCDFGPCDRAPYDLARSLAIATDVLIAVGAAAAVTGVVLFAVRPRARAMAVVPSGGGVALVGSF
jgi:tetratricopeptide (TPR) repeat protein